MNEYLRRSLEASRNCAGALLTAAVLAVFAYPASAQVPAEYETAPPPLRLMSDKERETLDAEKGIKNRTKLALELMDVRLEQASTASSGEKLEEVFTNLGAFHALMDNTLDFLENSDPNKSKVMHNFKRLEIGLRKFMPRLEMIRREVPLSHEYYVRSLMRQLRDARTRAVEPLFGETVIRDN